MRTVHKYSDWLWVSATLFRLLAVTYSLTTPQSISVFRNAWSRTSSPAYAFLESYKDSFSLQHVGRVWEGVGGHPATCSVFGRTQIRISVWRTGNLTNVSWLGFVFSDSYWTITWDDVTAVFFHVTLTSIAVEWLGSCCKPAVLTSPSRSY
jgi:hypothetical protein